MESLAIEDGVELRKEFFTADSDERTPQLPVKKIQVVSEAMRRAACSRRKEKSRKELLHKCLYCDVDFTRKANLQSRLTSPLLRTQVPKAGF
jgi:hypothetical protein